jgi:hypothetical protein
LLISSFKVQSNMLKKVSLIIFFCILCLSSQPAYAQKTTQRASKPQVFVMIIFTVIGLKALSYLRVP